MITLGNYENPGTLFEVVIGDEAIQLFNQIKDLRTKRKRQTQRRKNLRFKIKSCEASEKNKLEILVQKSLVRSSQINSEIVQLEKKLSIVAEDFGNYIFKKLTSILDSLAPIFSLQN